MTLTPEQEKRFDDTFPGYGGTITNTVRLKEFLASELSLQRQEIRREVEKEKESKDGAYHERDMLVCALSKVFPAYLARHSEEDKEWEDDWRWIVYIVIPTKRKVVSGDQHNHVPVKDWFETTNEQVSWHIHDSEREMFNHLEVCENNWDGHNTERKYERLNALSLLSPSKPTNEEA